VSDQRVCGAASDRRSDGAHLGECTRLGQKESATAGGHGALALWPSGRTRTFSWPRLHNCGVGAFCGGALGDVVSVGIYTVRNGGDGLALAHR
jgi:hypothetical protein